MVSGISDETNETNEAGEFPSQTALALQFSAFDRFGGDLNVQC